MECNLCGGNNLEEAIAINRLPISKDYSGSPFRFDLKLHYCHTCGLLQIVNPIPPSHFYDSKFYLTGFHKPKHIEDLISCALHYKDPGKIIEIGCNDGAILRDLKSFGFHTVAGIEPNHHAAQKAENLGIIYHEYLTSDVAKTIVKDSGKYDFVICRHVLEHVSNIKDFMEGINTLLSPDGILILEVPNTELGFDAISPIILFEEHVNHFTEKGLLEALRIFGFTPLEKRYYTFGGGSIALVCHKSERLNFVPQAAKSKSFYYYNSYANKLDNLKKKTMEWLNYHNQHAICLYGGASRSAMFINVMGINEKIDYVFDDRKELHGLIMPGTAKEISAFSSPEAKSVGLLGIGSENEWKVAKKFDKTLSLFAPRFNLNILSLT